MIIHSKKDLAKIKKIAEDLKSEKDLENLQEALDQNIEDILCNQCGESCKTHLGNFEGLIEVIASGGYESKFIGDSSSLKFSLCEDCLKRLCKSFKIQPAVRDDQKSYDEPFVQPEPPKNTKIMPQNENLVIDLISKKSKK